MACPDNLPGTFVLKLALFCAFCDGCVKEVKKTVKKIQGVDSIIIDTKEGVATISGKVDPHTVIKELQNCDKINNVEQIHGADDSIDAEEERLPKKSNHVKKIELAGERKNIPKKSKQELQIHGVNHPIDAEQIGEGKRQPEKSKKVTHEPEKDKKINAELGGEGKNLPKKSKHAVKEPEKDKKIDAELGGEGKNQPKKSKHDVKEPEKDKKIDAELNLPKKSKHAVKEPEKDKKIDAELGGEGKNQPKKRKHDVKELEKDKKIDAELGGEGKNLPKKSKQELQIHGERDSIVAKQEKATVSGEEKSLSKFNKQDQEIVLQQNQHRKNKVAPDIISIEEPKAKTIHNRYPKYVHEHELELRCDNKPFKCDACREDGFQQRRRCEPCNHDRHKECMDPKGTTSVVLFKGLPFEFCDEKTEHTCDACGRKIHGYSYRRKDKDLDLHPFCANLKGKLCISGTNFVLKKKVKHKCYWCKQKRANWLENDKVQGWCYVSEQNKCYLHVYCISQIMHEAWKTGYLDRKDDEDVDDASMALARLDLKLVANVEKNGGRGGIPFLKILAVLIKTVLGIVVGDPTALISAVIMEVISN